MNLLSEVSEDKENKYPEGRIPCIMGHILCYTSTQTCMYDLDINGRLMFCANGAHLQNCENNNCTHTYKCPNSYCIPHRFVCDGKHDCINGEDEKHCQNYTCYNMFKCKGTSMCLYPVEVCDSVVHCRLGDDELLCGLEDCPAGCNCIGLAVECSYTNYTHVPVISVPTRGLQMIGNTLKITNDSLSKLLSLNVLALSGNRITDICGDVIHFGQFLTGILSLEYLGLSNNGIQNLTHLCFDNLHDLKELYLQGNFIIPH